MTTELSPPIIRYITIILFLKFTDNKYDDPELDRFLEVFREREPSVAVIGDAYTREEAERYQDVIDELREDYPNRRFVVAPK